MRKLPLHTVQIAGVADEAEAQVLLDAGVDLLGFPLGLPVNSEDISIESAAALIAKLDIASRSVLITYGHKAKDLHALANTLGCAWIQLHGDIALSELEELRNLDPTRGLMKSLIVRSGSKSLLEQACALAPFVDAFITDTHDPLTGADGATGRVHDWSLSAEIADADLPPLMLAGGLSQDNIEVAIARVKPWAVDAHTSVEDAMGRKDFSRVRAFVQGAKRGFASLASLLLMASFDSFAQIVRQAFLSLALFALLLPSFFSLAQAAPRTLHVACAANFLLTLEHLQKDFEAQENCRVLISSSSTGKLYAQIAQGAPFDIFFAADERRPLLIEEAGGAVDGSRRPYALGQLALWWPQQRDSLAELPRDNFSIAIGNPLTAPYGRAAQQALMSMDRADLLAHAVRGESILQAFNYVQGGQVRAGFVAYSLLKEYANLHPHELGLTRLLSVDIYDPIVQSVLILKRSEEIELAFALLDYLESDPVRLRLAAAGYGLPQKGECTSKP
jgi:phosphoribosylanthranilate isomerase